MTWKILKGNMIWASNRGYRIEGTPKSGYTCVAPTGHPCGLGQRLSDAKRKCENHLRRARRAAR